MLEIYVFKLGYVGGVDLYRVARLVNAPQNIIRLIVGDAVRNIGEPNLGGIIYSKAQLFNLFPVVDIKAIRVGITIAPLEGNFYTHTQSTNAILISLFQTDELCEKAKRTKEEYIAQTALTELLWLQYKSRKSNSHFSDLFHQDTRGCIFDFVAHKPDKIHKLKIGQIDPICKGKLVEANVPESVVTAVERIIKRIQRPSFIGSLIQGLSKPLFSFVFGGVFIGLIINTLSSLALGEFDSIRDYFIVGFLFLLAIALAVGNYIWMLVLSNSNRNTV